VGSSKSLPESVETSVITPRQSTCVGISPNPHDFLPLASVCHLVRRALQHRLPTDATIIREHHLE
jgi:hypothetical protein